MSDLENLKTLQVQKINESFSRISGPKEVLLEIFGTLKVEKPDAKYDPGVQGGWKDPFTYFCKSDGKDLFVPNGLLDFLGKFGIQGEQKTTEFTEKEIDKFLENILPVLPFPPHDFQEKTFKESLLRGKQINRLCTSAGKSLSISLIVEFLRLKGKKGLLLVPNINLLTQFKDDIKSYNLTELYENTHVIGGGQTIRHFEKPLTISTWQSLQNHKKGLDEIDFIIVDEAHKFASDVTGDVVKSTTECKIKLAFTGTLPEDPAAKMELLGMFGNPVTYITSKELIARGLATPVNINTIFLKYTKQEVDYFRNNLRGYPKQLGFIKEHSRRNELVVNLLCSVKNVGNTLCLFSHTEHGKELFISTMKKLHPGVEVQNKDITGKNSFEFQEKYGVYFINGEDSAEIREKTRKILEEHTNCILISNYQLLSTGVSIKALFNLVLASPLKSYTTVTQSIGRGMRLHKDKKLFQVYDLVDDFGVRTKGGIFYKQYQHRLTSSYLPEDFPITEREFHLI